MKPKEQMQQARSSYIKPHEMDVFEEQLRTAPFFGLSHKETMLNVVESQKDSIK